MMTTPGPRSLYRPEYEHDSCGVAFVVDMYGRQSRDIVEKAIAALVNLEPVSYTHLTLPTKRIV